MPALYSICRDVLIHPADTHEWVISNPRVHTHVQVDRAAMGVIMELSAGAPPSDWIARLVGGSGKNRTRFAQADGLMADPTGVGPPGPDSLSGEKLFHLLRDAWILHANQGEDYIQFLSPKRTLLDAEHFGTFHQILGRHLLLDLRTRDTWRWWHDQKFTPDGRTIRNGPYKWVQDYFFKSYFEKFDLKGRRVLDYACGNGYFSEQFRKYGAQVVGIDRSADLIRIAASNYGSSIEFYRTESEEDGLARLAGYPEESFDLIYVSDALLFFFHDLKTGEERKDDLLKLLLAFRRLIRPGGKLCIMEPNSVFWLASRLGDPGRPIAVVTEYRHKLYHVAPTPDQVVAGLFRSRFAVSELIHPEIDPEAEKWDPKTFHFCRMFPVWDFYCAVPLD